MEHLRGTLQSGLVDKLIMALSNFPLDQLENPVLSLRAFIQDGDDANPEGGAFETTGQHQSGEFLTSYQVNLRDTGSAAFEMSPESSLPPSGPSPQSLHRSHIQPADRPATSVARDLTRSLTNSRKRQGGLCPVSMTPTTVEDVESRRQMQVRQENFPKRAKAKHDGVFRLEDSSLSKFIVGVWEQIHSGHVMEPYVLSEQVQLTSTTAGVRHGIGVASSAAVGTQHNPDITYETFSRSNLFCRKVTQASRASRSIEVIVQARWVELFDAYVECRATMNPELSLTKIRMRALAEACTDFGWTEKELRNKMAIWRGYKEIKDVLGWVALVFSGMGLYRLCKYRIDFDKEKLQRVRPLRLRMEVAADTLHHNWRQVLAIVGEPTERRFDGHHHDWSVSQDESDPVPLRSTYHQYDPDFSFEHIDESVIDTTLWGADDPRWAPPPNTAMCIAGANACDLCGQMQSNDAAHNSCKCFPNLFGGPRLPCPVQIFRTCSERNNGLQALVSFDRGVAIGEFVGLVTRDIEDQDVLDIREIYLAGDAAYFTAIGVVLIRSVFVASLAADTLTGDGSR
ncbi:SET domain-containing protein [Fusarium napiforme]|uniref:SET domain-containing protein n=1 Tax=Fusarium napiforme TaxID=42672 RepID=A0A8H5IGL3_9HYPO|nr:SET domain-containing protein [Fusarium napiforme]